MTTFFWHPTVNRLSRRVLLFDAAGLGLFVAAGTDKALALHVGPVAAVLFGTLTGIGGGMVRDLLVREIPAVLRTDVYALAGILGAAVIVGARMEGVSAHLASFLGFFVCFAIRLCAIRYDWHLPAAKVRGLPPE